MKASIHSIITAVLTIGFAACGLLVKDLYDKVNSLHDRDNLLAKGLVMKVCHESDRLRRRIESVESHMDKTDKLLKGRFEERVVSPNIVVPVATEVPNKVLPIYGREGK